MDIINKNMGIKVKLWFIIALIAFILVCTVLVKLTEYLGKQPT